MQDLLFKFKFKVLLFKKGVISILHGLGNGNKWGCCGKLNWKEMENAGSLGNIFIYWLTFANEFENTILCYYFYAYT